MAQRNARNPDEMDLQQLAIETEQEDLAFVMADPRGRRFMWALMGKCGVYTNAFNTNFGVSAFACGRQSVGQDLLRRVTTERPEQYLQMQAEAIALDKADRQRVTREE